MSEFEVKELISAVKTLTVAVEQMTNSVDGLVDRFYLLDEKCSEPKVLKDYYTYREAGEFLGCTPQAIRYMVNIGKLENVIRNGKNRITGDSLMKKKGYEVN